MERNLDVTERLNWILNQIYSFNIQVVIQLSKSMQKNHIREAFFHLKKRHPLLNSQIIGKRKPALRIASFLTVPIKYIRQKINIQHLIHKELHTPFTLSSDSLIRALVVASPKSHYIIITINHIISDGMSGAALVKEFLENLDNITSQRPVVDREKFNEFISFEKRLSPILGQPSHRVMKSNSRKLTKQVVKSNENLPNPTESSPQAGLTLKKTLRSTFTLQRNLTQNETQHLINQCLKHKIKINALTSAALLLVLSKKIIASGAGNKKIIVYSLINMRPYLIAPTSNDCLGHMTSQLIQVLDTQKQDVWKLAQYFQRQFNKKLNANEHIRFLLDFNRWVLSFTHKDKLADITSLPFPCIIVSNLGNLTIPKKYKNFSLKKLTFNTSSHIFKGNNNKVFVIVHSLHGKMNFNFHFVKPEVSAKEAKLLVEMVMEYFK